MSLVSKVYHTSTLCSLLPVPRKCWLEEIAFAITTPLRSFMFEYFVISYVFSVNGALKERYLHFCTNIVKRKFVCRE